MCAPGVWKHGGSVWRDDEFASENDGVIVGDVIGGLDGCDGHLVFFDDALTACHLSRLCGTPAAPFVAGVLVDGVAAGSAAVGMGGTLVFSAALAGFLSSLTAGAYTGL